VGKAFGSSVSFFRILWTKDELRPFTYLFLCINGALLLVAKFFKSTRESIRAFYICASIAIWLVLLLAATRTGRVPGISRKGSGGGGFGGRSVSA